MWERLAVLGHLANVLNDRPDLGKTKVQKLVFLMEELEEMPLDYNFHFYHHGPYSNALASDLGYLEGVSMLKVSYDAKRGAFHIQPNTETKQLLDRGSVFLETESPKLKRIVDIFGSKSARDLELLSTIVYVAKKDPDFSPENKDRLLQITRTLKPHFSEKEVRQGADFLRSKGYLAKQSQHAR